MSVPAIRQSPAAVTVVVRLAALSIFLTAAMGAVVSATDSGAACPTWPGCRPGDVAPPWALSPVIEFTHRVVAVTAGPLILAAAVLCWRTSGLDRRVRALPWVALVGALAAGFVGRLVVLRGVPAWVGAVDLCCALTATTVLGVAAVLVSGDPARPAAERVAPVAVPGVTRVAAAGVAVLVAMHVTGILTAGPRSFTRTVGWPFWRLIGTDRYPWLQVLRLVLAAAAAGLVVAAAVAASRDARLRPWGIAAGALLVAETALGIVIRVAGLHAGVAAGYAVVAVCLLWCLGLLGAVSLRAGSPPAAG